MHITELVTKDGKSYQGVLEVFMPEKSLIAITIWEGKIPHYREFAIGDLKKAITKNERLSINKIGDEDLIVKARWFLSEGRKNNWVETPKEEFAWEKNL